MEEIDWQKIKRKKSPANETAGDRIMVKNETIKRRYGFFTSCVPVTELVSSIVKVDFAESVVK